MNYVKKYYVGHLAKLSILRLRTIIYISGSDSRCLSLLEMIDPQQLSYLLYLLKINIGKGLSGWQQLPKIYPFLSYHGNWMGAERPQPLYISTICEAE